jgi:hypothetical protein
MQLMPGQGGLFGVLEWAKEAYRRPAVLIIFCLPVVQTAIFIVWKRVMPARSGDLRRTIRLVVLLWFVAILSIVARQMVDCIAWSIGLGVYGGGLTPEDQLPVLRWFRTM